MTGIQQVGARVVAGAVAERAATELVESLPTALRSDWLRETWTGVHGSRALRSHVEGTEMSVTLGSGGLSATATAEGAIRERGRKVGQFTREVRLDAERLSVHHEYLALNPSAQGTGFARSFNDHAFGRYAAAGVDRVELFAALDVGGYAWARQGFELAARGASDGERMLNRGRGIRGFIRTAIQERSISADEARYLRSRALAPDLQLASDTLTSVQELAALPNDLGRRVLLGQSWWGERPIEPTVRWLDTMQVPGRPSSSLRDASDAAAALRSRLPEPLHPDAVFDTVESATGGRLERAGWDVSATTYDGEAPVVRGRYRFSSGESGPAGHPDRLSVEVTPNRYGGLQVTERAVSQLGEPTTIPGSLRARLNQAWSELGMQTRRTPIRHLERPVLPPS